MNTSHNRANSILIRRVVAVLIGALIAVAGNAGRSSAAPNPNANARAHERSGQAAIDFLGDRLDDVARDLKIKPAKLKETLRHDQSLKIDDDFNALYVDEAPEQAAMAAAAMTTTTPPYDVSQTFALHSRPGATRKIYLDFNGHTTSGTNWNSFYTGGRVFTTQPFDLDGFPGSFSTAEHALIQQTWLAVREDFAQFNVDVTTQDPGVESLRKTWSTDAAHGTRVVIGPNSWYPYSAGGVGYVGSFSWSYDNPVFVFTNRSSSTKFVAEASSHEVGHSVGLSHDGTSTTGYYAGHGNWAPIMGNSYSKGVTQWSRGEYAGANNLQNDLAIIAGHTSWANDDYYGNTSTGATLPAGTRRYGVVNWTGDADAFKFSLGGTRTIRIQSWANTGPIDPNLNTRLILRNAAGGPVVVSSPTTSLGASFTVTLPAGTYYLYVDGVGEGSPYNTGYSSYASQGYYGVVLNWA